MFTVVTLKYTTASSLIDYYAFWFIWHGKSISLKKYIEVNYPGMENEMEVGSDSGADST